MLRFCRVWLAGILSSLSGPVSSGDNDDGTGPDQTEGREPAVASRLLAARGRHGNAGGCQGCAERKVDLGYDLVCLLGCAASLDQRPLEHGAAVDNGQGGQAAPKDKSVPQARPAGDLADQRVAGRQAAQETADGES
jgi:hypothetical protein